MSRILALASALLLLSQVEAGTTIIGNSGNQCPNNWEQNIWNDKTFCCPGAIYNTDDNPDNEDSAYCCVGATYSVAVPTFASCFPSCTDGSGESTIATSKVPCSISVFLTDSNYNSKVTAAASGGTLDAQTTAAAGSGSGSGSSAAQTGSSSASSAQSGSSSASAAAQTGSSSSSSAGAAMVTSGPLAGALMIAGGLLLV